MQLAGAEIRFITDGATRAAQVQTGEADISLSIPVSGLAALESATPTSRSSRPIRPRTATLYMNNGRAPFDDVDFRKAVRSALDLEALAASVYEGAAVAASGPFAPSEPWAIQRPARRSRTSRKPRSCSPAPATPQTARWRSSPSLNARSSRTSPPSSRTT